MRYTLDQAEIPTFQERGLSRGELLARKRAEVATGLSLTVDGARVPLALGAGRRAVAPRGAGRAEDHPRRARAAARMRAGAHVVVRDRTFAGRVGWRAIRAVPGGGTAVRSSAAVDDPTRDLTVYPEALLRSPSDVRDGDAARVAGRRAR